MTELMDKIYYMLQEEAGKLCAQKAERKVLMGRRAAMTEQIIEQLGEDGEELLDELNNLEADIETLYDKAMFQIMLRLAVEIARLTPPAQMAHS